MPSVIRHWQSLLSGAGVAGPMDSDTAFAPSHSPARSSARSSALASCTHPPQVVPGHAVADRQAVPQTHPDYS